MRWFRNDPADGDAAHAPEASRPWWSEPSDVAGVPPLEPDFDAIVGGDAAATGSPTATSAVTDGEAPRVPASLPQRRTVLGGVPRAVEAPLAQTGPQPAVDLPAVVSGPEAYVPVFAPADDAGSDAAGTTEQHDDAAADVAAIIAPAPITDPEETAVPVGIDEGTDADVAIEPLDLPEDADAAPPEEVTAPERDVVVGQSADTLPPAQPGGEDDAEEVHVPVVELGLSFGERIERLIAAAVTEADHTRADAQHEAEQLVQSARLDAEHAVAAAQRQSSEIVAATQRRCDDELAAAQHTRAEAEQALADAREEAENLRRRVRDEVAEMRQEIDLHAQAMLARTRADTNRTLASARAELEEIAQRKAELEEQMSSIRALLSDAVVEPLPQDLTDLLGGQAGEATEPGTPEA
ncbi:hypothetical protein Xcel_3124 [Xylanimonas cellulosilytica DSM 15894]|uniref:Uncharacterized protein n=1 Tax=Xylanimonas cellulosilytica (strain DSM 15894 / JCM 12276 / CECT 5975 / KCTC 9989 / LMG 20990 / NBRC 107835 / XIL07) TaxID=446471 RepID=D1BZZ7_XYLCX|nr:hypothetical protein [Xylanimonas cellulosilytica]ACZ32125.1 hypothetical protein Xcel_3124 [Xylanimonas cellulosilytica DSM 15894]